MKTKASPFKRVSTLSGLTPVLVAVVFSAFTSASIAQQNLCDLDPNWPIISQSSNQYVFHSISGSVRRFLRCRFMLVSKHTPERMFLWDFHRVGRRFGRLELELS